MSTLDPFSFIRLACWELDFHFTEDGISNYSHALMRGSIFSLIQTKADAHLNALQFDLQINSNHKVTWEKLQQKVLQEPRLDLQKLQDIITQILMTDTYSDRKEKKNTKNL